MRLVNHGNGNLEIRDAVISYPHLFTPRPVGGPGQQQSEPKFSASFILPQVTPEEREVWWAIYLEAVNRTWPQGDYPKDSAGRPDFERSKDCFKLSPKLQESLGVKYPGALFCAAGSAKNRPPAVGIGGFRAVPEQESQIFGGCIVNAVVRVYCYKNQANGITAALNGVVLVDNLNVERLDGGVDAAKLLGIGGLPGAPTPMVDPPSQPGPQVPGAQQVAPPAPPSWLD